MGDLSLESLTTALFRRPTAQRDAINLRVAFGLFLLWLAALTVAGRLGMAVHTTTMQAGLIVWGLSLMMFYLSLCCTFFPAPTAWIIMLLASDYMAAAAGISGTPVVRLLVVSGCGAIATAMANLNEYHILTFMLR
mgnify:FL=1